MKIPTWLAELIAAQGGRVLEHAVTEDEAIDEITEQIIVKGRFAQAIVHDYARRRLTAWTITHRPELAADDADGQLELFPELPRHLEVAPGRFAALGVMTGRDWDAALVQAKTKAANAAGFADTVQQAYDKVRPLLTDDELTTADVWRPDGPGEAIAGGAG